MKRKLKIIALLMFLMVTLLTMIGCTNQHALDPDFKLVVIPACIFGIISGISLFISMRGDNDVVALLKLFVGIGACLFSIVVLFMM